MSGTLAASGLQQSGLENVYWGLLIVTYPFISGLVAGSFVVSSLSHVFKNRRFDGLAPLAVLVSFALLLAAPLTVLADARQPSNLLEMFTRGHWPWSPLGDFLLIWLAYVVLMLFELYFVFREPNAERGRSPGWRGRLARALALGSRDLGERARRRDAAVLTGLSAFGIVLAFFFHGYIGFVFGALKGRPLWSTPLMPVLFIASAMVSGLALMVLVYIAVSKFYGDRPDRTITQGLLRYMVLFLLLDLFLDGVDLLTSAVSGYAQADVSSGFSRIYLHGPLTFSYLGLQLGIGLVLPLALWLIRPVRNSTAGTVLIALLVLTGIYAMRWNVVIGGQLQSKISQSILNVSVPLTGFDSVQTVLGVFAVALLLFLVLAWLLPWRSRRAVTGLEAAPSATAVQPSAFAGGPEGEPL
jgi:Ni/Fe-hydrogenase subunit HybB-like protein